MDFLKKAAVSPLHLKSAAAGRASAPRAGAKTACLGLALFCAPLSAFSHKPDKKGDQDLALKIFEAAVRFAPEITGEFAKEAGGPPAKSPQKTGGEKLKEPGKAVPFVKVKGQKIYLTSGFWRLTQLWLRLYIREAQNYCPCDLDPRLLAEEARASPPESLVLKKTKRGALEMAESLAGWTYSYGPAFAAANAAAEIAETVFFNWHVFCKLNNIIVMLAIRRIQKYFRIISYGRALDKSRLAMTLKQIWLARLLKKARKRAFFAFEGEISLRGGQALKAVDQEGRRPGNRIRWLRKLPESRLPIAVSRKRFFGKRSFLIIPRKRNPQHMRGKGFSDKVTSNGLFWILSIQEDILQRALKASESGGGRPAAWEAPEPAGDSPDSIRHYLIDEFLSKSHQSAPEAERRAARAAVSALLQDVENIFNPHLPPFERYLHAHIIELSMGFFAERHIEMAAAKIKELKRIQTFSETIRLRKHTGRFVYESYLFSDFLLSASMAADREKLAFYKYKSMKKILSFFESAGKIHKILEAAEDRALPETLKSFEEVNREFASIAPGREKNAAFFARPFGRPRLSCRELAARRPL